MGFLDRLGVHVSRETPEAPVARYQLAPVNVSSDILDLLPFGDRGTTAIPAAYRGATFITDLAGQLPWQAWRGGKHSDALEITTPTLLNPRPPLLVDPSPFMDADEVKRAIVLSLIFRGNAFLHLTNHDLDGRPRFATPINPDEVTVGWDDRRVHRVYRWRNQLMFDGIDLLHIPLIRLPGEALGLGPFSAAWAVLNGIVAADAYARELFSDSAVPSITLSVPGKLSEPEAQQLRAQWEAQHQGGRGTAVLSGGLTVDALSLTPEQAQFLQTRGWGVQEIARLLGIPQHFLNAGNAPGSSSSLTYTNVQAVFREFTTTTLYPTYLRRIERAFTKLLPRGTSVQFDLSDLLKADDGSRYTALKTAIDAGILTVEEVRAAEDLPTVAPLAASLGEA